MPTKVCMVKAVIFSSSHVLMWDLNHKEGWEPKNWSFLTMVFEKTLESPFDCKGSNQSILKEINPENSLKGWCWNWSSNHLATWCQEPTHWKRPWCWERQKAGREVNDRGQDGWIASLTQWTWVGDGTRQGGLACCSPWIFKELDMTEGQNTTKCWHIGLKQTVDRYKY